MVGLRQLILIALMVYFVGFIAVEGQREAESRASNYGADSIHELISSKPRSCSRILKRKCEVCCKGGDSSRTTSTTTRKPDDSDSDDDDSELSSPAIYNGEAGRGGTRSQCLEALGKMRKRDPVPLICCAVKIVAQRNPDCQPAPGRIEKPKILF